MSQGIKKPEERQDVLKGIIKDLHAGVPMETLKKRFEKILKHASPEEIADMENSLIKEGFPAAEIRKLCDVHVQVFEKSLKKVGKAGKIPGHPLHTFRLENDETRRRMKTLGKRAKDCAKGKSLDAFKAEFETFKALDNHYIRKENQLFPLLERKGFTGPTQVMWGKHDEIRQQLKAIDKAMEQGDGKDIAAKWKEAASAIKKMLFLEEKILYPTSAKKLDDKDWAEIYNGEKAIGYAWVKPGSVWEPMLAAPPAPLIFSSEKSDASQALKLSEGLLNAGQIDMMLKTIPVDVTFVDADDRVQYYTDSSHRVFPRSPAIIGRAVQNCHPPDSVDVVEKILKAFKEKKKDKAEFWLTLNGRFVHIRYFPMYDDVGEYAGVIEVSQDVTDIRALDGEQRLLDWED